MATLAVTNTSASGTVEPTPVAAAGGGDQVAWTNDLRLKVVNGSVGSITVTVTAQVACDQGSIHSIANAVAAGATELMGPFTSRYVDANGYIQLSYSGVTSLTIAPFR